MRKLLFQACSVALALTIAVPGMAQSGPKPTPTPTPTRSSAPQDKKKDQPSKKPVQQQPNNKGTKLREAAREKADYGTWNSSWGAKPPPPPAHWTNAGDWYRHVRACQKRYRSYKPKTDTYHTYSGKDVRCRL